MFVSHFIHYYVDQIEAYVDHDTTPQGGNISPPLCSNKGDIYLLVTYLPTYLLTYLPNYVLTYLLTYLLIINASGFQLETRTSQTSSRLTKDYLELPI